MICSITNHSVCMGVLGQFMLHGIARGTSRHDSASLACILIQYHTRRPAAPWSIMSAAIMLNDGILNHGPQLSAVEKGLCPRLGNACVCRHPTQRPLSPEYWPPPQICLSPETAASQSKAALVGARKRLTERLIENSEMRHSCRMG